MRPARPPNQSLANPPHSLYQPGPHPTLQRALAALSGDAPRVSFVEVSDGDADSEAVNRIENKDLRRKQVIGRKIQQGDAQYALTYGMMLGIRVMTGRKEMYHSSHDSSDTFELTDDDFLWNMSLEFPPGGHDHRPVPWRQDV